MYKMKLIVSSVLVLFFYNSFAKFVPSQDKINFIKTIKQNRLNSFNFLYYSVENSAEHKSKGSKVASYLVLDSIEKKVICLWLQIMCQI